MSQDTTTPAQSRYQVPGALHEATRSLLRLRTTGDTRRVAQHLVHELGGRLVPAGDDDPADTRPAIRSCACSAACSGGTVRERDTAGRFGGEQIVVDLLAAAQRDVGERWYRNEITPADEHVASG